MEVEVKKYIFDIEEATQEIQDFVKNLDFEKYASNRLIKAAVERKFEIIGEALNRIKKVSPGSLNKIRNFEKIISFRNVLAHDSGC